MLLSRALRYLSVRQGVFDVGKDIFHVKGIVFLGNRDLGRADQSRIMVSFHARLQAVGQAKSLVVQAHGDLVLMAYEHAHAAGGLGGSSAGEHATASAARLIKSADKHPATIAFLWENRLKIDRRITAFLFLIVSQNRGECKRLQKNKFAKRIQRNFQKPIAFLILLCYNIAVVKITTTGV